MSTRNAFGPWLKQQRQKRGFTQEALATRIGYAPITIRKLEAELLHPSRELAELLADALEIPPTEREQFILAACGLARPPTAITSLAPWLKQRRLTLGLSQGDLAQRTGYAVSTIRKLEAGTRTPSSGLVEALATALNLTPAERTFFRQFPEEAAPPSRPTRPPTNVLLPATPLIGRVVELAALKQHLEQGQASPLTLTGPPGIGKTRLSYALAVVQRDAYRDGVFFVALASLTEPEQVAPTIAQTLGLQISAQPEEALQNFFRDQQILLILDTFEHLLAATPLVRALVANAPGMHLVVTSRARLELPTEQEFPVPPLAVPTVVPDWAPSKADLKQVVEYPAVALFLQRAQLATEDFALTRTNASSIVQICQRLEGLPLAIELAAARIKRFGTTAILEQLSHHLDQLELGARAHPPRHRTLRAAIDWSYQLLWSAEQRLLRHLAIFRGGATFAAIGTVIDPDGTLPLVEYLDSLVAKNLVQPEEGAEGQTRYTMLEMIHAYAWEQLSSHEGQDGTLARLAQRHAQYYVALAQTPLPEFLGPRHPFWMAFFEREHDNFRAVLQRATEQGDTETVITLSGALSLFWKRRGYLIETRHWLEVAYALFSSQPTSRLAAPHAQVLIELGHLINEASPAAERPRAAMLLQAGLDVARALGDDVKIGLALHNYATLVYYNGDFPQAHALLQESLEHYRRADFALGQADIFLTLGYHLGDQQFFEEALAIYHAGDNGWGIANVRLMMGERARSRGDYALAQSYYLESLAKARELNQTSQIAPLLHNIGAVALAQNDATNAAASFLEGLIVSHRIAYTFVAAACLAGFAGALGRMGNARPAARLLGAAEAAFTACGRHYDHADRPVYDQSIAIIQGQLSESAWHGAWNAGHAMTLGEAITFARDIAAAEESIAPSP